MMKKEIVLHQIEIYTQAVQKLSEAIAHDDLSDFLQDAILQRFEFCIELAWKTGKKILEWQGYNDLRFPTEVIKIMHQTSLIDDVAIWINFLEYRNILSHCYGGQTAHRIYQYIKKEYQRFEILQEAFQNLSL